MSGPHTTFRSTHWHPGKLTPSAIVPVMLRVSDLLKSWVDTSFTAAVSSNSDFKKYTITRIPAGRWAIPGEDTSDDCLA